MTTKTFSVACLTAILLLVGGVGLFNRIVDPYWYFREVEIDGFNQVKPHAAGNERLVKPALVSRLKPDAIILGNSVAEIGLPPTHRGFTNDGRLNSYNLALPGASWNEVYCLAMFVMRRTTVKRLVIGTAGEIAGNLVETCPPDDSLAQVEYGKLLFSRSAFAASRETLRQQHLPAVMTREGLWHFHRYDDHLKTDEQLTDDVVGHIRKDLCQDVRAEERKFDWTRLPKTPVPPNEGVNLRTLIRLAETRQIELVLLLYPTHVLLSEVNRACHSAESKWEALWRVVSIADQEGDPSRIQIWDFAAYVPINAERPHDAKPRRERLWQEMLHFNEPVGSAAFDAIYLGHSSYGDRVSVGNFADLVARREIERTHFLHDNPWVRAEFDVLARRVATPSPKQP